MLEEIKMNPLKLSFDIIKKKDIIVTDKKLWTLFNYRKPREK